MEKAVEQEKVVEKNEPTKGEVIDGLISKLEKNEFNIHFYCPAMNQPSGGIGVLLRVAAAYKKQGFNVKVWYEPSMNREASMQASQQAKKEVEVFDIFNPNWVDFDISGIEFFPLKESKDGKIICTDGKVKQTFSLQLATEDFMFIPEGFPNVMERTINAPCKRIILAQSWLYVLAGMKNGQMWQNFGINDVVSVSDCISQYIGAIMPGIQIKSLKQGINRDIFYKPEKLSDKMPLIGYQRGRGPESEMKMHTIIKMFYAANPHMRWFRFMEMSGMSRNEFAERLRDCAFVLYTDDIAGFGTLPLEAMACGTHVIGFDAPGGREYATDKNGFWSQNGNLFGLAELLGIAADKWVSGQIDLETSLQAEYEKTLDKYTVEGEEKRVLEIIEEYKNERIDEFNRAKEA